MHPPHVRVGIVQQIVKLIPEASLKLAGVEKLAGFPGFVRAKEFFERGLLVPVDLLVQQHIHQRLAVQEVCAFHQGDDDAWEVRCQCHCASSLSS